MNRDLTDEITLETDLRGFAGYGLIEHIALEHGDFKAVNSAAGETVAPHAASGQDELDGGMLKSRLGAASWNVIRLRKSK